MEKVLLKFDPPSCYHTESDVSWWRRLRYVLDLNLFGVAMDLSLMYPPCYRGRLGLFCVSTFKSLYQFGLFAGGKWIIAKSHWCKSGWSCQTRGSWGHLGKTSFGYRSKWKGQATPEVHAIASRDFGWSSTCGALAAQCTGWSIDARSSGLQCTSFCCESICRSCCWLVAGKMWRQCSKPTANDSSTQRCWYGQGGHLWAAVGCWCFLWCWQRESCRFSAARCWTPFWGGEGSLLDPSSATGCRRSATNQLLVLWKWAHWTGWTNRISLVATVWSSSFWTTGSGTSSRGRTNWNWNLYQYFLGSFAGKNSTKHLDRVYSTCEPNRVHKIHKNISMDSCSSWTLGWTCIYWSSKNQSSKLSGGRETAFPRIFKDLRWTKVVLKNQFGEKKQQLWHLF